ncbi:hypothetical protein Zmor_016315 [Zophobas morio]|uniref:Lanosterol 14-alpha demethylase n=1 Tax=Zophobas morio TaxID=2755281 RepID=A0AA38LZ46_9CUCU|nr:hypothetical protein Zmor_016315 [Zophobas morio]
MNLFEFLSELIIATASRCLLGAEIRSKLDSSVAKLYSDLDGGFSSVASLAAWLLPAWVPLPSLIRRDRAHHALKRIFQEIIEARRKENRLNESDMLATFMTATYRNGTQLTDEQVSGMCIAMLLAGQHTSSTTSAWLGFFLCTSKQLKEKCRSEVRNVISDSLSYDNLKELVTLDHCLKETLRLRPPIMTLMRRCKKSFKVNNFVVPEGHIVCVSPTVNHILQEHWKDPEKFSPDRFESTKEGLPTAECNEGGGTNVKCGKYSYVPFGAGRHRCVGEMFAYLQIKTIWAVLLDELDFERDDLPAINYQTMIHTPLNPLVRYRRLKPSP